jgi:hypothetical protein
MSYISRYTAGLIRQLGEGGDPFLRQSAGAVGRIIVVLDGLRPLW